MKFLDFVSGIFSLKPNRKNDTHANAGSASPPFLPSLTRPDPNVIPAFFHPLFWSSKDHETVTDCAKKIVSLGEGGYHFGDNFLTWGKNISMISSVPTFFRGERADWARNPHLNLLRVA
jgi:hypothetical protein